MGDSVLWSKTEVHLCGFLWSTQCRRHGGFDVKFALQLRMGFKGRIIMVSLDAQSKQT